VTRRGKSLRVGANRRTSVPVLSVITDFLFVSIATYLVLDYGWTILFRPISLLLVAREIFYTVYLLMALTFLAVRNNARNFTARRVDHLYTFLAFSAPLFFQPSSYSGPMFARVLLEFVGLGFVVSAFLFLNRSFGLAPQNRGIKTAGVYRLVRHPMYLGYILAYVGYVLDDFSNFNIFVLAASVLFLLLRLNAEERLLEQDPAYKEYSEKTRWKLIPFLF